MTDDATGTDDDETRVRRRASAREACARSKRVTQRGVDDATTLEFGVTCYGARANGARAVMRAMRV